MATRNEKVHALIHTAATAAGAVGGGLAQLPGSDAPVLMQVQMSLIVAIAHEYGIPMTTAAAGSLLPTFTAAVGGRLVTQWLVGWIPGWGNAINAATAIALTESVGWAAVAYCEKSSDVR